MWRAAVPRLRDSPALLKSAGQEPLRVRAIAAESQAAQTDPTSAPGLRARVAEEGAPAGRAELLPELVSIDILCLLALSACLPLLSLLLLLAPLVPIDAQTEAPLDEIPGIHGNVKGTTEDLKEMQHFLIIISGVLVIGLLLVIIMLRLMSSLLANKKQEPNANISKKGSGAGVKRSQLAEDETVDTVSVSCWRGPTATTGFRLGVIRLGVTATQAGWANPNLGRQRNNTSQGAYESFSGRDLFS